MREAGLVGRHVRETTHAHGMPVHLAGHTLARLFLDVLHHGVIASMPRQIAFGAQPLPVLIARVQFLHGLLPGRRDAFRQNVYGIAFHHAGHHQNVALVVRRAVLERPLNAHDLRLLDGKRAGFVEEDMRYAAQVFQHILRFDKNARFGEATGAGHIRDGSGDQQRAGRGQNQHLRESQWRACDGPRDAGDRQRKNGERHRQHIGGFDDGRARFLRRRHQFEDLLILRILRQLRGTHRQRGRSVDRTRQHARARIHFARHRLAVDIAQIQRGDARQQFAVDRHRFARQHEDHVAKLDLVDRNGFEMLAGRVVRLGTRFVRFTRNGHISSGTANTGITSPGNLAEPTLRHVRRMLATGRMHMTAHARQGHHMSGPRCCINQRGQVAFRLRLCEFLNRLAGGNHQHHGPRSPVFLHRHRRRDRNNRKQIHTDVTVPQIVNHADHSHHNRVHDQRDHDPLPDTRIERSESQRDARSLPRTPRTQQCQRNRGNDGDRQQRNFFANGNDSTHENLLTLVSDALLTHRRPACADHRYTA